MGVFDFNGVLFSILQNNFLHPNFNLKYTFCVNVVEIGAVLDMKVGGYGHADIFSKTVSQFRVPQNGYVKRKLKIDF